MEKLGYDGEEKEEYDEEDCEPIDTEEAEEGLEPFDEPFIPDWDFYEEPKDKVSKITLNDFECQTKLGWRHIGCRKAEVAFKVINSVLLIYAGIRLP